MSSDRAPDDQRRADHELARRCLAGERAAQRLLFATHRRHVDRILHRLLGRRSEPEDLIQEAFLQIFRSLSLYRGDATLVTWIDRITTRVAYRHIAITARTPRPVRLDLLPPQPHDASPVDDRVGARAAARRLNDIVETLDPAHRTAFKLQMVDGRPLREVATLSGTTLVASRVRVWRARRHIEAAARADAELAELLGLEHTAIETDAACDIDATASPSGA